MSWEEKGIRLLRNRRCHIQYLEQLVVDWSMKKIGPDPPKRGKNFQKKKSDNSMEGNSLTQRWKKYRATCLHPPNYPKLSLSLTRRKYVERKALSQKKISTTRSAASTIQNGNLLIHSYMISMFCSGPFNI